MDLVYHIEAEQTQIMSACQENDIEKVRECLQYGVRDFFYKPVLITTLWGKKLHPCYFCNNFVKSHYVSILFDIQILK